MEERFDIPGHVIDQVTEALNIAISLATRFEPSLTEKMIAAGVALDDAVNDSA